MGLLLASCGRTEKNDCYQYLDVFEYGEANAQAGHEACQECSLNGYTDIGFLRFDLHNGWNARDDSLMRLTYRAAGISLQSNLRAFRKLVIENYCTGNLDTAYYFDMVSPCLSCPKGPINYIREIQRVDYYLNAEGDTVVYWYNPAPEGW
jgi:hypothetical protein